MKEKETIAVIVLCALVLVGIAVQAANRYLGVPAPPRVVDPFLAAAKPGAFDVAKSLDADFNLIEHLEELPIGLQQAVGRVADNDSLFIPNCDKGIIDGLAYSLKTNCAPHSFLFAGVNRNAAFVVYSSHFSVETDVVVIIGLASLLYFAALLSSGTWRHIQRSPHPASTGYPVLGLLCLFAATRCRQPQVLQE